MAISSCRELTGFFLQQVALLPISSMFLILFSFLCPKDTLNHTRRARHRPMSPRQLSPVASTRRHVAQVEKKKKIERGKLKAILGRARAQTLRAYQRVYKRPLVSFPGTTPRDTFDVTRAVPRECEQECDFTNSFREITC